MSCEQEVLDLFLSNNKPYSQQNLVDLLAYKGHKKAAIGKALDALTEAGRIRKKEFGKTCIFIPVQGQTDVLSKEELDAKQAETAGYKRELAEIQAANRALEQELHSLRNLPSEEEVAAQTAEITQKLSEGQAKLAEFKKGAVLVAAGDRDEAIKELEACVGHWRRRKAIFRSIWDQIAESREAGEKDADMFERMGVDTDEEVGVKLSDIEALKPAPAPFVRRSLGGHGAPPRPGGGGVQVGAVGRVAAAVSPAAVKPAAKRPAPDSGAGVKTGKGNGGKASGGVRASGGGKASGGAKKAKQ